MGMRRAEFRAALLRYATLKQAMGGDKEAEVLKSLQSLVRSNQGFYKSPAQAQFLYTEARARGHANNVAVEAFARKYQRKGGPNTYGVLLAKNLGYAHRDAAKIRYVMKVFLLDGAGVVAMGTPQVKYPTNQDIARGRMMPTILRKVDTDFVRSGSGPVLFDAGAVQREFDEKMRDLLPLIRKIEELPGVDDPDNRDMKIFRDFLTRLKSGTPLTPAQMKVLQKALRDPSLALAPEAELAAWQTYHPRLVELVEDKIVIPTLKFLKGEGPTLDPNGVEWMNKVYTSLKKSWTQHKRSPTKKMGQTTGPSVGVIASSLGLDTKILTHLLPMAAKLSRLGARAPKTALREVAQIRKALEFMEKLSPNQTLTYLRQQYAPAEPADDPFADLEW